MSEKDRRKDPPILSNPLPPANWTGQHEIHPRSLSDSIVQVFTMGRKLPWWAYLVLFTSSLCGLTAKINKSNSRQARPQSTLKAPFNPQSQTPESFSTGR